MDNIKKHSFWIVIALTLMACVYAYFQFLLPLDVFLWDEAHHGFFGMQIYNDLSVGDWGLFWAHTNNQALWMPLHSWLDGIFLLIFGFSYASTRLGSLFLFFICSTLIYLIGFELSEEKGWIIGLLASFLFLTSPMMLHLATVNMQEMLGIFVCLITVYFMVRNVSVNTVWKFLIIGFLLSVAYWAKQNFAMVTVFGVGLFQLSLLWDMRKKLRAWCLDNLYIILGFLPLFVFWWIMPPFARKYGLTVAFRQGSLAEGTSIVSTFIGTLFFYVQSFITSYNLSFWIALGGLASVVASLFFFRNQKIRIVSLMFYANLIFISIMSFAQERYLSLAMPLAFPLLVYFGLIVFERIKSNKKVAILVYAVTAIIAVSFVYDFSCLTRYTKEVANRSIMFFIYKDSLNRFSPPFVFGLTGRPTFTYPQDFTKDKYNNFKVLPKSEIRDVLAFFSSNININKSISTFISYAQLSPYVVYWHFSGWMAPVFTVNDFPVVQRYFWRADYFLDLQAAPDSPYYADWLERRWDKVGPMLLKGGYITLAASKEFTDLGLTANIYKREKDIVPR